MIDYLRAASGFAGRAVVRQAECEARVKRDSAATIRCLPLDGAQAVGSMHLLRPARPIRRRLGPGVFRN